jgi:hypothetical protein
MIKQIGLIDSLDAFYSTMKYMLNLQQTQVAWKCFPATEICSVLFTVQYIPFSYNGNYWNSNKCI